MNFFNHLEFEHHEQVVFCHDQAAGLNAIIAIHNTQFGPAIGGTRFYPYASEEHALTDVLRLSKGMTYKNVMAGLPAGGGKSVILGDPGKDKTTALLEAFGHALNRLGGHYIAAEDSGTSVADMKVINRVSNYVTGFHEKQQGDGQLRSGDPSPATAFGCFLGIRSAVKFALQQESLEGLTVGIQGLGNVGFRLAELLFQEGAKIVATDVNEQALTQAQEKFGAKIVAPEDIYHCDMDVFAPCALGATINPETIAQLKAKVIAGSANNQLDHPETAELLLQNGILYAPDYVINAGGVIDVCYEQFGNYQPEKVTRHIATIEQTLTEIFTRARSEGTSTAKLADDMARERLAQGWKQSLWQRAG